MAAAVAVAALGAVVLGEYQLGPAAGLAAGVIVGLALTEVALMASGTRTLSITAAAVVAVAGFGALVWAGWIDVQHRNQSIGLGAWLGAVAAAATVVVRTRLGSARSAGSDSPPDPRRTP